LKNIDRKKENKEKNQTGRGEALTRFIKLDEEAIRVK